MEQGGLHATGLVPAQPHSSVLLGQGEQPGQVNQSSFIGNETIKTYLFAKSVRKVD